MRRDLFYFRQISAKTSGALAQLDRSAPLIFVLLRLIFSRALPETGISNQDGKVLNRRPLRGSSVLLVGGVLRERVCLCV